jgi:hypothetical protein
VRITESYFVIESHEIEPLNPLTKKQAEQKINRVIGELYGFRNRGKELLEIENIIRQMYGGQITPEKAVAEAQQVLEIKNSYTAMYKSFLNLFNNF